MSWKEKIEQIKELMQQIHDLSSPLDTVPCTIITRLCDKYLQPMGIEPTEQMLAFMCQDNEVILMLSDDCTSGIRELSEQIQAICQETKMIIGASTAPPASM